MPSGRERTKIQRRRTQRLRRRSLSMEEAVHRFLTRRTPAAIRITRNRNSRKKGPHRRSMSFRSKTPAKSKESAKNVTSRLIDSLAMSKMRAPAKSSLP